MAGYIGTKTASLSTTAANVTGNITVSGNVDGRDVSVDGTKLDTIPVISTSSTASFIAISDGTTDGYIQLNCSANSHGIKLKSPPHSAGASYTLVFPVNDGNANQVLTTNGSGVLSWSTTSSTDSTKLPLAGGALTGVLTTNSNVGIGTATPQTRIHSTSSQEQLTLSEGNAKGATFDYRSSTGNLNIATNGANARSAPQLTLDLNGHVLVGGTSATPWSLTSGSGAVVRSEGYAGFAASGAAIELNRVGSFGNIANFRKAGTTVGSIGTPYTGELSVSASGTNSSGILLSSSNQVRPMKNGSTSSSTQDLGASNGLWKDLYLSGGVFLGGTSAVNRLDDYEEGNHFPQKSNGGTVTYGSGTQGHYTKVGELVTYYFDMSISAASGESGSMAITLPFAANAGDSYMAFLPWIVDTNYTGSSYKANGFVNGGSNKMLGYKINSGNSSGYGYINNNVTGRFSGVITYFSG